MPPIHRVTTTTTAATTIGTPPVSSWLLNWIEGFVTELDFNLPIGTVLDNHYAAQGVTFEALSSTGARSGNVLAAAGPAVNSVPPGGPPVLDPDPNDPRGPASHTISITNGGFNDLQGGIRAIFKQPQLFVSLDVRSTIDTSEFEEPDSVSLPYLFVFGLPPKILNPGKAHLHVGLVPPLLARVYLPIGNRDPNFETWQTLSFLSTSPTPNIGSIEFSCHNGGVGSAAPVFSYFDILRFAHHLPLTEIDDVG